MENFRVVQFLRNIAAGRDPQKLKSAKNIPSLSKVKPIIHNVQRYGFAVVIFVTYEGVSKSSCTNAISFQWRKMQYQTFVIC